MTPLTLTTALVGIATTAVIYGTDVFSALVLRPAAAGAADLAVVDVLGRVHHDGDRRLPIPGITAVLAVAVAIASSTPARTGATVALLAELSWLAIYLRRPTARRGGIHLNLAIALPGASAAGRLRVVGRVRLPDLTPLSLGMPGAGCWPPTPSGSSIPCRRGSAPPANDCWIPMPGEWTPFSG